MKISSRSEGFTVVETLVVLAVSGGLLLTAILFIGNRQAKTQFSTGSRDLLSRFQQVIDDVSNGYYPNNGTITCRDVGGVPTISGGSASQGTNQECIFLGRVIQFHVGNPDPEKYQVYSVVGVRKNSSGELVQDMSQANPRLITTSGLVSSGTMPYGMTTQWVKINNSTAIGSVGFLSSIGYIDSTGAAQGPSQQVDVYPVPGTSLGQDQAGAVASIIAPSGIKSATPNPNNGVQICVKSGSTNQSVLYTIGGQGRQVSVSMAFKNGGNCA